MERKMYEPTEKQNKNWSEFQGRQMPSDDEFKAQWQAHHHGKIRGWGMGKRDWILSNMTCCREYQMGLWQARADFVQGLDYQNEPLCDENVNAYNLGYYRGWNDGRPLSGLDSGTIDRLQTQYGK
jgi:hypothetical protein